MQETLVQSLVQEDPTCRGATKLVNHSNWAHVLQLLKPEGPGTQAPQEQPLQREAHEPQLEKAHMQQRRPSAAKK